MEENNVEVPQYKDGKIICDGVEYRLFAYPAEREFYNEEVHQLVRPNPGEVPQRVRGSFFYGGRVFIRSDRNSPSVGRKNEVDEVLLEARLRQRSDLGRQTSSIPEEFWPEVLRRTDAGETSRDVARWLREEKHVSTTYASVSRLCRRLLAAEAEKSQADERQRELVGYKHQYRESMTVIEELRIEAFRRAVAGDQEDDPAMERAFRFAKAEAQLLDRQIRLGTSRLASAPSSPPSPAKPPEPKPPEPKREESWERKQRQLDVYDAQQRAREAQAAEEAKRAQEAVRQEPAQVEPQQQTAADVEREATYQKMMEENRKVRREIEAARAKAGRIVGLFLLLTLGGLSSARAATVDSSFERGCTPSGGPFTRIVQGADARERTVSQRAGTDARRSPMRNTDVPPVGGSTPSAQPAQT